MRLLLAALAGFALAVVPALATGHNRVQTVGDTGWDPPLVSLTAGETVTWRNAGGTHNVKFTDGSYEQPEVPSEAWEVSRTFATAGTYDYVCAAHPGMQGRVVVEAAATTTTTTQTTTAATPAPTPAPTSAPIVRDVTVKVLGRVFSRRRGVRLRVTSDRARTLTGTLRRGTRRFGSLRLRARKGTRVVRFTRTRAGRRLARGSYRLTLRARGAYGLPVTVRFRVR